MESYKFLYRKLPLSWTLIGKSRKVKENRLKLHVQINVVLEDMWYVLESRVCVFVVKFKKK